MRGVDALAAARYDLGAMERTNLAGGFPRCPHLSSILAFTTALVACAPGTPLHPELGTPPPESFSVVVIPDSQKYRGRGTKIEPNSADEVTNATLDSHVRWIAANLETQRIAFVTHVGDIVDRKVPEQWAVARRCMDQLNGRVPLGVAPGNHDMGADGNSAMFVKEFGPARFSGETWYGGAFKGDLRDDPSRDGASSFQLFSAGGMDLIIQHLECNAPDPVLSWADGVLRRHAARRAIVTTHMDLGPIQRPVKNEDFFKAPKGRMAWKKVHGARGNTPQQMWDKCLRKHSNVFLILSGDQSRTQALRLTSVGDHGNTVHSLLSDYMQDPGDCLRVLRFLPAQDRIDVLTVNSRDGTLCRGTRLVPDASQHCFALSYPMAGGDGRSAAAAGSAAASLFAAQGEMAGEPTQTTVILQSRLTGAAGLTDGDVPGAAGWACFEISTDRRFQDALRTGCVAATPERDFIVKIRVTGLRPATKYYYRLVYGSTREGATEGPARTFKTLPATDAVTVVRFVVGNCMNYSFFHRGPKGTGEGAAPAADRELGYPAMEAIRRLQPDFFVGVGDNVYYDHPARTAAKTREELRRKWHEQFVQPRLVSLFGEVAAYWLKDDHDYRYNDSDPSGDRAPSHELGISTFLEQLPVVDPAEKEPVTFRTYSINRLLQIWMLEGRDHRSPNAMPDGPEKSLWGVRQREWLKQSLLNSDATFRFVVSPTPIIGPDDAYKKDNHTNPNGFRHEGDAFHAWLRERNMKNVFLLCGDRHWQYHSVHPGGAEEFCCGALNDENSRLGPKGVRSTDPDGLIRQPYTQTERSGGFLQVQITAEPKAEFTFFDDLGIRLYQAARPVRAETRKQPTCEERP